MSRAGGAPRHRGRLRRGSVRARARHASDLGDGFGRFVGLTGLSLVPGAGLLAVGRRHAGALLLGVVVLGFVALAVLAATGRATTFVLNLAVRPSALISIAVAVVIGALIWCASILLTAREARPSRLTGTQRLAAGTFVATLCVAIMAPSAVAARYAVIQRGVVTSLFPSGPQVAHRPGVAAPKVAAGDPWQKAPRVNLLLIGSDAGADRTGIRTDSLMVASIDTKTGRTTLFGIPRNLQNVPFPESNPLHKLWPNGFDCGSECLMNAVWRQAEAHPELFPHSDPKTIGLSTTRDVVGEILGLRIDYYTIIDLRGFESLVDAMGGVDVNVPRRIPIGGGHNQFTGAQQKIYGYIEPGQQHLDGYHALWFSRSREGSDDYDRMRRQRCMVGALINQANPGQLLKDYPKLAAVAKDNIVTDVPQQDLPAWVELVNRIKKGSVTSLPFTNRVVVPADPDFDAIRRLVQKAINPPKPTPKPSGSAGGSSSTTTTKRPTSSSSTAPDESTGSQSLSQVC